MLCAACQIQFPFYLKYCRQCGEKLIRQARPSDENTLRLASTSQRAETGEPAYAFKYNTAPMTIDFSAEQFTIADMLRNVMASFPSIDTVRMSELLTGAIALPRQLSIADRMKATLREFSFEEFTAIEKSNTAPLRAPAGFEDALSCTLELPVPAVADTVPFAKPAESTEVEADNDTRALKTNSLRASARIHMRPLAPTAPIAAAPTQADLSRRFFLRARRLFDNAVIRWYNFTSELLVWLSSEK